MNNQNFYKITYKDGSTLGTTAESADDALNIAYAAPGQNKGSIDDIQVRDERRWISAPTSKARRDGDDGNRD